MRRISASVLAVLLMASLQVGLGSPAGAQEPIIDNCTVRASTPAIDERPGIGYFVTASGTTSCNTNRPFISVVVCLFNTGVIWPICGADMATNSASISAPVEAPCLPGAWTAVAYGAATGIGPLVDLGGPTVVTFDCLDPATRP